MRAELRMPNGVTRRGHAGERWLHDRWIRTAEMRRARAEAIAEGVHWVWTKARRAVERLMNGRSPADRPARNGIDSLAILAAIASSLPRSNEDTIKTP